MRQSFKIFLLTTFLSVLTVCIYHFQLREVVELDCLSHLFGGVSLSIGFSVFCQLAGWKLSFVRTVVSYIVILSLFELVEHLLFCTVLSGVYRGYNIFTVTNRLYQVDTLVDIISGLGGCLIGKIYYSSRVEDIMTQPGGFDKVE